MSNWGSKSPFDGQAEARESLLGDYSDHEEGNGKDDKLNMYVRLQTSSDGPITAVTRTRVRAHGLAQLPYPMPSALTCVAAFLFMYARSLEHPRPPCCGHAARGWCSGHHVLPGGAGAADVDRLRVFAL